MDISLSRRVKRAAQDRTIHFTVFNSIGFGFTGASTVCLLALSYGASDMQMSLLYSGVYLMNFTALLVPVFLAGRETTSVLKVSIWIRGLCTGLYPLLLFLPSPEAKIWGAIAIYLAFLFARGISMSAFSPVYKGICSAKDLPVFIGRLFSMFNLGTLVSASVCFVVMEYMVARFGWFQEEHAFMGLFVIGFLLNLQAARVLSKLPATGYVEGGSFASIKEAFSTVARTGKLRGILLLSMLQTGMAIIAAFMMSYLKYIVHMTPGRIFLLTAVGFVAGIAIAQGLRVAGPHISSRSILFSSHVLLMIMGGVWAFADRIGTQTMGLYAALYGLSAVGLAGSSNVVFKIQTSSLPEKGRFLVNIVYQIGITLAALVAIGSTRILPDLAHLLGLSGGHPYTPAFLLWALLSLAIVIQSVFILRNEDKKGILNDLSMLTPANLFNIFRFQRSEGKNTSFRHHNITEGIMMQRTHTSRAILAEWMNSANLQQRISALRTINHTHTPELFEAVFNEAKAVESPLRSEAITTLGFLNNRGAVEFLYECLNDFSSQVRGVAIKTLFRLGENLSPEVVVRNYFDSSDTRSRLDILIGVVAARKKELLFRLLGKELHSRPGPYWSQTVLAFTAEIYNRRETLQEIFNEESRQPGEGLNYLLAEMETELPDPLSTDELRSLFATEDYDELNIRLNAHHPADWICFYDRTTALGGLLLWYLEMEETDIGKS